MRGSDDPKKLAKRAELEAQYQQFLMNGGQVKTLDYLVSRAGEPEKKGHQRWKCTNKSDEDIGFKHPTEKVKQPKVEMTTMSEGKKAVPTAPTIDLSALKIEKGITIPNKSRVSKSQWIPLLSMMEEGDSIFIEGRKSSQLSYVKKLAEREGINVEIFSVIEKGVEGCRIFRVKEADASADGLEDDGL